jgi:hypothetical protein
MSPTVCEDAPGSPRLVAGALAVRPRPIQDEAATGYLIRASQANGFTTPRQLWHALRLSNAHPVTFDELMDVLGVIPEDRQFLLGPLPHYWKSPPVLGPGLVVNDYNHSVLRWCSSCIEESPYLRGVWGLKLQCACTRHRCMLSDRCPVCGITQRFERTEITRCFCGARLTAVERVDAPRLVCELCECLANGSNNGVTRSLPALDAGAWHRLVRYLGQFSMEPEPRCPGQLAGLHLLDTATTLIIGAARLLEDWPKQFNFVLQQIQGRRQDSQSLRRSFGSIYRVLYSDLQAPYFQFLRDAFEAYLSENWWGFVCRRNRSLRSETVANHPRLTLACAARQADISVSVVRHLVQSELIPGKESAMPSGRRTRSIHCSEVQRLAKLARGALTLTDVASLLALPKRRVRELVDVGLLTPLVSRRKTNAAAWLFPEPQLREYCSITGLHRVGAASVSLKQILKSWRLRNDEFAAIVKAIAEEELVPLSEGPNPLGRLTLDARTVRAWLKARRLAIDETLSVDQAACVLGVKQEVAYGLVARGYLPGMTTATGERRIRKADIRLFTETYVSLVALARSHARSPRATMQALQVSPVCGPTVDGSRQYFFRRADLRGEELPPVI